jgi:protease I
METILSGKKICILVASGFTEKNFSDFQKYFSKSGASIKVVAPENGLAHGWHDDAWGHYFPIDVQINEAMGSDFDRLVLPGGARAVEKLKSNLHMRRIIRHFFEAHKPIVAIEESIELLALCDHLHGLEISAPAALVQPMKAAGAVISDQDATIDEHLLTFAHLNENWLETVTQHLVEDQQVQRAA